MPHLPAPDGAGEGHVHHRGRGGLEARGQPEFRGGAPEQPLGGPAELLFLLVVGNKVIDQSLRYTLDKTTFVTLLQPLPGRQRLRVQAGLESMVEPLSGGVAGLLLFGHIYAGDE